MIRGFLLVERGLRARRKDEPGGGGAASRRVLALEEDLGLLPRQLVLRKVRDTGWARTVGCAGQPLVELETTSIDVRNEARIAHAKHAVMTLEMAFTARISPCTRPSMLLDAVTTQAELDT